MRGLLKIASQRSPYLRAGLGWPAREPVQVDIRTLDGERLLELVTDPVLTVMVGTDADTFRPFPAPAPGEQYTGRQLQLMIDGMAEDLPPIGEEADAAPSIERQLLDAQDSSMRLADALEAAKNREAAIAEQLGAAGFTSVEQLISAHVAKVSEVDSLTDQLNALKAGQDAHPATAAAKRPKPNTKSATATEAT